MENLLNMRKNLMHLWAFALVAAACVSLTACDSEEEGEEVNLLAGTQWAEDGQLWNGKVAHYFTYIFDDTYLTVGYLRNNRDESGNWIKETTAKFKYTLKGDTFTYSNTKGVSGTAKWFSTADGRMIVDWPEGSGSPQQVWYPLAGEVKKLYDNAVEVDEESGK